MIPDNQTNFLYLADCLPKKYPTFYKNLEKVLTECKIAFDLLPGTKDVWAVDYMPLQVKDEHFVQFVYAPDYLKPVKWQKTISDTDNICKAINVKPVQSDIIIDGGNVVRFVDTVIMCDKVFRENPTLSERELIKQLKNILEVERLFFVPQDRHDFTGHADGMVRFLDARTVLINECSKEDLNFEYAFRMSLHNAGFEYIEVPYNPDNIYNDSAKGLYLNYLQMEGIVIVPTFGTETDDIAVKQFEQLFSGHKIRTITSNEIAAQGGVLNCISWNIKS